MTPRPDVMRVALDVTAAARQRAGIGRYVRELAAALVRRGRAEYVPFLVDSGPTHLEVAGDVTLTPRRTWLPNSLMERLWYRMGLPLCAERFTGPVDVYHATDFLVPPLRAARAVVTVHDLSFLVCPEYAVPSLAAYLARTVPRAVARAAHVLADSENTRRDLVRLLNTPAERVSVAYPGLTPELARAERDHGREVTVRARYGLPGDYVLAVGTLEPRKNWPGLIAAFDALAPAATSLAIAGGAGWGATEVEIAAWRARAPVRLLGFVPDDDLAVLYGAARAFAYPSAYEGFGLPPLEALSRGVPTLVSDAGSLAEVAGDAALVVPAGDDEALVEGLRRLLTDDGLRAELAARGPVQAARFTWEAAAQVAEAAYVRAAGAPTTL